MFNAVLFLIFVAIFLAELNCLMIIITQEIITKFIQENNIVLKSTQPKLCISIVNRIYHKMLLGIKFDAIKVHQTLVCDGHHRYLASLLAG